MCENILRHCAPAREIATPAVMQTGRADRCGLGQRAVLAESRESAAALDEDFKNEQFCPATFYLYF